jgi:hypothetical protein
MNSIDAQVDFSKLLSGGTKDIEYVNTASPELRNTGGGYENNSNDRLIPSYKPHP